MILSLLYLVFHQHALVVERHRKDRPTRGTVSIDKTMHKFGSLKAILSIAFVNYKVCLSSSTWIFIDESFSRKLLQSEIELRTFSRM